MEEMNGEIYCGPEDVNIPRQSCLNRQQTVRELEGMSDSPATRVRLSGLKDCQKCKGKGAETIGEKEMPENKQGKKCAECGKDKEDCEGTFYGGRCQNCREILKAGRKNVSSAVNSANNSADRAGLESAPRKYKKRQTTKVNVNAIAAGGLLPGAASPSTKMLTALLKKAAEFKKLYAAMKTLRDIGGMDIEMPEISELTADE